MKKITLIFGLLISSVLLFSFIPKEKEKKSDVSVSMYENLTVKNSQNQTWYDLKVEIDSIMGKKMVLLTPELNSKIMECTNLFYKEWESKKGPSVAPDMIYLKFCWQLRCHRGMAGGDPIGCGYVYICGCSTFGNGCQPGGACPNCSYGHLDTYVGNCDFCND
jgi:hypothetical protein